MINSLIDDPLEDMLASILDAGLLAHHIRNIGTAVGNRQLARAGQELLDGADRCLASLSRLYGGGDELDKLVTGKET